MNISAIIAATILVAAVGLFIGVFLGAAGKKFAVEIDEKEVAIREALPGNNCGGCGYPGCDGLAAAIAKGEAPVNRCPVGGEPVGKIIAGIMGQAAVETARQVAHVKCSGTCEKAKEEYIYTGVEDCEMLPFVPNGGAKTCTYGCCGFGSCVKVCPFDAIHIVDGIAVVDKEACKACGKCVAKCPRHLIELIPYDQKVAVDCSSHDKGKQVMDACEIGCIGCKKCEKHVQTVQLPWKISVHILIMRSVQDAEHVRRPVREGLSGRHKIKMKSLYFQTVGIECKLYENQQLEYRLYSLGSERV